MMQGDDIRDQRILAEKSCATASKITSDAELRMFISTHRNLALWVIAEQLFEIRANFAILIERSEKEKGGI